jgi:hypothetical protein
MTMGDTHAYRSYNYTDKRKNTMPSRLHPPQELAVTVVNPRIMGFVCEVVKLTQLQDSSFSVVCAGPEKKRGRRGVF